MNTMQRIFDRLVGIAQLDAESHAQAERIFRDTSVMIENLERPACWRRPARIRVPIAPLNLAAMPQNR